MLDAANAAIAFNKLYALDGGHELWDEVVGVYDQGLEHSSRSNGGGDLLGKCVDTHACLEKEDEEELDKRVKPQRFADRCGCVGRAREANPYSEKLGASCW